MSSLYQLTNEYQALLDFGSSCDPEDHQAFLDTLEGLTGEVAEKTSLCDMPGSGRRGNERAGKRAGVHAEAS